MFREMRRKKQQLPLEDCIALLKNEPRGVLSVLGDAGYPYGVPMDFWYNEANGCLYFHCARQGHKLDAVKAWEKASFCVIDQGTRQGGDWPLHFQSVIVFGRIHLVEDEAEALAAVRRLGEKFTSDAAYLDDEITRARSRLQCLVLIPEHITGKSVKES